MSSVSISKCSSYKVAEEAIRDCLNNLGGISNFIKDGDTVLIKPNLLQAKKPEEAITTHPAVVEGIINIVKEVGAIPVVGDSPGWPVDDLKIYWETSGILEVCNRLDTKIANFEASGVYIKDLNGNRYFIARPVLDADLVINVPKIKTHGLTVFTCAVKNMYGVVPGLKKTEYHKQSPNPSKFARHVVDIYSLSKPGLNIVDGVIGMDGTGPSAGNPKELGMILASTDGVALDSLITHLLGKDPLKVPTTKIAYEMGLGKGDINKIQVLGYLPDIRTDFKWPPNIASSLDMVPSFIARALMKFYWARPSINGDKCTDCKTCIRSCPVDALKAGVYIPEFNYDDCIKCMCCMEMCPEKAVQIEKSLINRLFSRED